MKVKKKLDINPKRGKYFISLAKLIIPENNLGKTTIPEYPTWVHVHTHSLGNHILLAMAQKSIISTLVEKNPSTQKYTIKKPQTDHNCQEKETNKPLELQV